MVLTLAIILAVASFAAVAYPLFQRKEEALSSEFLDPRKDELLSRREAVYGAIKELDFEYNLGNLSQEDYQDLRNQYRQKAAYVLKEMDELEVSEPAETDTSRNWDDEIEEAVRRLRAGQGKARPRARPKQPGTVCQVCSAEVETGDRFCASCGSVLTQACSGCGAALASGDKFCTVCGAKVAKVRK